MNEKIQKLLKNLRVARGMLIAQLESLEGKRIAVFNRIYPDDNGKAVFLRYEGIVIDVSERTKGISIKLKTNGEKIYVEIHSDSEIYVID